MTHIPTRAAPYLVTLNPDYIAPLSARTVTLNDIAATLTAQVSSFRAMGDVTSDDGTPDDSAIVEKLGVTDDDPHTLLVTLSEDERTALASSYGAAILIEPDIDIDMFDTLPHGAGPVGALNFFASAAGALTLDVVVKSTDGLPVPRAEISVQGSQAYSLVSAVTDTAGKATLTLYGETAASLRDIKVKPSADYWGLVIARPDLTGLPVKKKAIQVALDLTPITLHTSEDDVWGYRAMGLDRAPSAAAKPVRIAVIDSGIAASHDDLDPAGGHDFTNRGDATNAWRDDLSGHGTHVAGTCAALFNGRGICGAAGPQAQVFGLSVFPGGRASSLIAALDWCCTHKIDVVNMSLGSAQGTTALHQAIIRSVNDGITLVAAAGNAARPVMFPAAYPEVIAVAAIGKTGSFPANSPHAAHIGTHRAGEYFSAAFTCFGPEIDVAAPGVAVISAVPSDANASYAANDGTSMASPYVAGFAARLLATSAALQSLPRDQSRVAAMKTALLQTCVDVGLPSAFQGSGLPVWPVDAPAPAPAQSTTLVTQLRQISAQLSRELA